MGPDPSRSLAKLHGATTPTTGVTTPTTGATASTTGTAKPSHNSVYALTTSIVNPVSVTVKGNAETNFDGNSVESSTGGLADALTAGPMAHSRQTSHSMPFGRPSHSASRRTWRWR